MTIKFTKTGVGVENGDESLLFEFLDHEVPSNMELEWETALATSEFANDKQTNQLIGTYLNPITFSGKLFGNYLDEAKKRIINANDRFDQLKRLEKRIIKFWYEGIKQLVVIDELRKGYYSINECEYTITLQPHDIQIAVEPSKREQMKDESQFALTTPTSTKRLPEDIDKKMQGEEFLFFFKPKKDNTQLTEEDKKRALKQIDREIQELKKKGNLEKKINESKKSSLLNNIINYKKVKLAPVDNKESELRYYKIDGVYVGLNQNEESEYKKKLGIK